MNHGPRNGGYWWREVDCAVGEPSGIFENHGSRYGVTGVVGWIAEVNSPKSLKTTDLNYANDRLIPGNKITSRDQSITLL